MQSPTRYGGYFGPKIPIPDGNGGWKTYLMGEMSSDLRHIVKTQARHDREISELKDRQSRTSREMKYMGIVALALLNITQPMGFKITKELLEVALESVLK